MKHLYICLCCLLIGCYPPKYLIDAQKEIVLKQLAVQEQAIKADNALKHKIASALTHNREDKKPMLTWSGSGDYNIALEEPTQEFLPFYVMNMMTQSQTNNPNKFNINKPEYNLLNSNNNSSTLDAVGRLIESMMPALTALTTGLFTFGVKDNRSINNSFNEQ